MGFENEYFTYKFLQDHVELLGSRDDIKEAKKKAENRFQARSVPVNTLLCFWQRDLIRLVAEIQNRQSEYAAAPGAIFESEAAYSYYERQGKRAKEYAPRRFAYAVRQEKGSSIYKIHHLDHMI